MNSFIKIKMLSLGAEIHLIRREERKWLKRSRWCTRALKSGSNQPTPTELVHNQSYARDNFWGLRQHRLGLRPEARAANLAYGYLRGRPYKTVENKAYAPPDWAKVVHLVKRYGEGYRDADVRSVIEEWYKKSS